MTRWVISVISKRGTDVGFTPNSDRNCDLASGRYVPLTTKVQCSNNDPFDHVVGERQNRLWNGSLIDRRALFLKPRGF